MRQNKILLLFLFFQVQVVFAQEQIKSPSGLINANPIDNLPPYIKLVSGFGERPDWSHDGRFILF